VSSPCMLLMSQLFKGENVRSFYQLGKKKKYVFQLQNFSISWICWGWPGQNRSRTECCPASVLMPAWPVWWCFVVVYFFEKNNNPVDFHSKSVSLSLKYSRILQSYFQIVHNVHNMKDSCWMYIIHIYKQKKNSMKYKY